MNVKDKSLHTLVSPSVLNRTESNSGKYQYCVPRLDNQTVKFPDAEPDTSKMLITHLDMDPTEICNLRCTYCFKGKLPGRKMSLETAKQSIKFLVRYSEPVKDIGISLLGGEPLLSFPLLKKWVPWTHRYCEQRGKKIKISATTNGTVFKKEHHDFFKTWHIGLHLSIDGTPEVQDRERVFADGRGSSKKLEENLPRIFSAWRTVHARSTVVPETVPKLCESYRYFCDKGFLKVAFSLAYSEEWKNSEALHALEREFRGILAYHWQHMKLHNRYFVLRTLDKYVRSMKHKDQARSICGAGRGSLHVDTDGLLWPCHRLNGRRAHRNLVLGSVWGGFNNSLRESFMSINPSQDMRTSCADCEARSFCGGSCVAANWQESGDLYDPSEGNCQATRVLYRLCREHAERLKQEEPVQWNRYTKWVSGYKW